MNTETILFTLLRSAICDEQITDDVKNACTAETLEQVYALAQKHDMAHLIGHVAGNLGLPESDVLTKLKKTAVYAVYRYVQQNYEFERICKTLEQAQIPFVPLKGSVIRQYYPEPWMRTSCDIDILVHEDDLEQVSDVLTRQLGYGKGGVTPHDISFFAPNGVHLELHYDTMEETEIVCARKVLSRIWEGATASENWEYYCKVSDEVFYFYHVAHMAKHVQLGGCGIRPFLDLWILNHRVYFDPIKRNEILEQGGLLKFAKAAERLSEVWFSAASMDTSSEKFAKYILHAGVYGSMENRVIVGSGVKGGKLQYAISRIFLPYDVLKNLYPLIKKWRMLTPIFQVIRWFRILFGGGITNATRELHINAMSSSQQELMVKELFDYIGLR